MVTTKIFSRARKSTQAAASAAPGKADAATFDSDGLAKVDNADEYLAAFGDVNLAGTVHLDVSLDVGGDATTTYTVPAGKQWRLLSMVFEMVTDSSVATRTLRVVTSAETYTFAGHVASTTTRYQLVFEDDTQGLTRVEPTGTLTIAEQVTAGDTMTINGILITFVADDAITGTHQVSIGATEAAFKVNMDAAFGATPVKGVHSITQDIRDTMEVTAVDFSTDDMVFTYAGPGSATGDGEAVTLAETFTHANNVWDSGDTTLGGITAGVGAGTLEGSTRFPANGTLLEAAETVVVTEPVAADTGDDIDIYFTYIEYDVPIT